MQWVSKAWLPGNSSCLAVIGNTAVAICCQGNYLWGPPHPQWLVLEGGAGPPFPNHHLLLEPTLRHLRDTWMKP